MEPWMVKNEVNESQLLFFNKRKGALILLLVLGALLGPVGAFGGYWDQCGDSQSGTCGALPKSVADLSRGLNGALSEGKEPKIEVLQWSNTDIIRKRIKGQKGSAIDITKRGFTPPVRVEVDPSSLHQTVWGFGASITDSCLDNLAKMKPEARKKLMNRLFSKEKGAGFSYLRIPLGANDFSRGNYTLADSEDNVADPDLKSFDQSRFNEMASFAKEARSINNQREMKFMLSPWTSPAWMKDNKKLGGGQIKDQWLPSYAKYIEKAVDNLKGKGITVDHLTVLNEPLIGSAVVDWHFPQSFMSVNQQKRFLSDHLLPLYRTKKDFPQILLHDHNWDNSDQVLEMAQDKTLKPMVAGVANHCYGGDFKAEQAAFAQVRPLNSFNSECSGTFPKDTTGPDGLLERERDVLKYWLRYQAIGALRAGSTGSLGWNLCLDEKGGPQNGGCTSCRGLVTIDQSQGQKVIFNPEYEALAFVSRAVDPGAVVLSSNYTDVSELINVAVRNPDGRIVVLFHNLNDSKSNQVSLKVKPCQNEIQFEIPRGGAAAVYL